MDAVGVGALRRQGKVAGEGERRVSGRCRGGGARFEGPATVRQALASDRLPAA
jgi:hypothetical protein